MKSRNELDRCDCTVIHEDVVNTVKEKTPSDSRFNSRQRITDNTGERR